MPTSSVAPTDKQLPQYHLEHQAPVNAASSSNIDTVTPIKPRSFVPVQKRTPTSLLSHFESIQRKQQEQQDDVVDNNNDNAPSQHTDAQSSHTQSSHAAVPNNTTAAVALPSGTQTVLSSGGEAVRRTTQPAYINSLITNLLSPSKASKRDTHATTAPLSSSGDALVRSTSALEPHSSNPSSPLVHSNIYRYIYIFSLFPN